MADLTGDFAREPCMSSEFRAAMHRDAISHKKKNPPGCDGFLAEIGNSLADFEPAPNDAS